MTTTAKTFRFDFSKEFLNRLVDFHNSLHNTPPDYHSFKRNWENWKISNSEFIVEEHNRLMSRGFTGDMDHKMFHCVRSYIPKKQKPTTPQKPTAPSLGGNKHFPKEFLKTIDSYIILHYGSSKKPNDLFKQYQEEMATTLQDIDPLRLQKTFSNRYQTVKKII
jgi:hypothetical protein